MKKQILTVISRRLAGAAFLLVLPFVLGPTMHQALGQAQRSAKLSQVAPPSSDAISGTVPATAPSSKISASQLPALSGGASRVNAVRARPQFPTAGTKRPDVGCHVLIVYSDTGQPTQFQSEILAQPGVAAVDLFDGGAGTPTLAQLQQYGIVVPYSDTPFADATTLGNNLADYVDGGGVVVQFGFAHYGPGQPYGINGRWVSGGYNPYNYSTNLEFSAFSLGTHNAGHPLMAGVTALNSDFANIVTPSPGATEVALNSLGESLVAFRPVSGGHTTVGVTAYVGNDAIQSGDWGKVVVNAGNWLGACGGGGGGCQFKVLIAYADIGGQPTMIHDEIAAESGVTIVDYFDAFSGTPTLAQLQQYDIVFAFSDNAWNDATAMGNVLADYEDGGGILVVGTFAWDNRGGWLLGGRWVTGGYSPYNSTSTTNFSTNTANITHPAHPLMAGVSSLTAFFRNGVTLTSGASSVADWTDGPPAVAYKVNNGHTAVGLNAYLGYQNQFAGDWGRVIVNAGRWLRICGCNPNWQNESPMTNARRNAATAAVGSNLYAITGFDANPNYTTANERFDGTSWTARAPIPVRHAQGRATAVGTNIYVPGGFNSVDFSGPLNTMQIYNTVANTWSMGMTLPAARSGVATAAFNGLVYVISGYAAGFVPTNTVYIYDPGTNTYTTGAPMPAGQGNVAGVLLNGEIYVVGGGTAPGAQYAYNPTSNTWRTIAPLPTSGGTCQSDNGFVLNGQLWIVGCLGLPINQQVWVYDPNTNSWAAGPQYNVDHQGPGATLFNARGFVVGGGAASGGSTAVESIGSCVPTVTDAVSRKTHGAAGTFDINMPLTGSSGVESRTGGATHDYSLVVSFSGNVTVTGMPQAQVVMGTGCVGTGGVCDPNGTVSVSGNMVTVPLTNIADVQVINVQINGVNSASDEPAANVNIPMGILIGDVTANRTVNASDVALTKSQVGQVVGSGNFREDVNANGTITATDVSIVKSDVGHSLPP